MKNQCHLISTDANICDGLDHVAMCQKVVHNTRKAAIWDELVMQSQLSVYVLKMSNICRECVQRYCDRKSEKVETLFAVYDGKQERDEKNNQ